MNWYTNPAWPLVISAISLIVSWLALRKNKRTAKSEIERGLVNMSNEINEAFARHTTVTSPFAHRLKIESGQLETFSKKTAIIFMHINLLKYIHQHKDILDKATLISFEDWTAKIIQPWIQADDDLKNVWRLECESRMNCDRPFIEWLKGLIPTY